MGNILLFSIPPNQSAIVLKISYYIALQIQNPPGSSLIMFIKPPVTLYFVMYLFLTA